MAETQTPLAAVKVEALVVMKIIKHCNQTFPTTATGSLVGMDFDSNLEITNSFPFPVVEMPTESHFDNASPNPAAAAPRAKGNAAYQAEMIRMIREVNIDANNVGWYTSANMGNFVNMNVIENQFYYQKELNERTVALVHDVSRSAQGALSLRAFRLSAKFMEAFKENKFNSEEYVPFFLLLSVSLCVSRGYRIYVLTVSLQVAKVQHPLPRHLRGAPRGDPQLAPDHLLHPPAAEPRPLKLDRPPPSLAALEAGPFNKSNTLTPNFDNLSLSIDPFLEKNCDLLLDSIEAHNTEVNNYQYYQRVLGREQTKINNWKQKRAQENATRATLKQPLLPEDEWQRLFKLPAEPSRLESMLNTRQVEQFSRQVDSFVSSTTGKMFAAKGNLLPETAN
ncbi:Eukaryotic translation initiation factor 3 subunit H [Penicillium verhagenii]|uniref:Eukaryotic translation initiation factor 3 subunit H n=1 Tax=Penicillium verhagenii TaxID=1562060 RepID=UPI002544F7C9|nr:Eukaryotic translation initiation factor 3 subunit H [Penicillium verhagenii]KAJ5939558.1 Eukaryotic translation initiation factor 3 subunit H [Penicillium verhagenii]